MSRQPVEGEVWSLNSSGERFAILRIDASKGAAIVTIQYIDGGAVQKKGATWLSNVANATLVENPIEVELQFAREKSAAAKGAAEAEAAAAQKAAEDSKEAARQALMASMTPEQKVIFLQDENDRNEGRLRYNQRYLDNAQAELSTFNIRDKIVNYFKDRNRQVKIVVIESDVTDIAEGTLAEGAFETITIPATIKTISAQAFKGCTKLKTVIIEGSLLQKIGEFAFENCKSLETVIFSDASASLMSIDAGAFRHCENLKCINLPASLTKIAFAAFYNCQSLVEVAIPQGVSIISLEAFAMCFKLEEIKFEGGAESALRLIDTQAFYSNFAIKHIAFPPNLQAIGRAAFQNCLQLEDLTIPPNVRILFHDSFKNCYQQGKLKVVRIPSTCKYAFNINSLPLAEMFEYSVNTRFDATNEMVCEPIEEMMICAFDAGFVPTVFAVNSPTSGATEPVPVVIAVNYPTAREIQNPILSPSTLEPNTSSISNSDDPGGCCVVM